MMKTVKASGGGWCSGAVASRSLSWCSTPDWSLRVAVRCRAKVVLSVWSLTRINVCGEEKWSDGLNDFPPTHSQQHTQQLLTIASPFFAEGLSFWVQLKVWNGGVLAYSKKHALFGHMFIFVFYLNTWSGGVNSPTKSELDSTSDLWAPSIPGSQFVYKWAFSQVSGEPRALWAMHSG